MRSLLLTLLILFSSTLQAKEVVGSVILSFGQNIAVSAEGEERILKRQSDLFSGDLLKTGSKGRLQVKFSDGSRLALKPATEFKIDDYTFDASSPEEGKAILQLLKGGMRTISGQIGKKNKENYRLETTVATIGIRGTHYGVEYTAEGIYCETIEGAIQVATPKRTIIVSAGEGAFWTRSGMVEKVKPTGQTGDGADSSDLQASSDSEEAQTEEQQSADNGDSASAAGSGSLTDIEVDTITPAADVTVEGSTNTLIVAPNPTGRGTAAPTGALTAISFTNNDGGTQLKGSNGSVLVDSSSAITVDGSLGTGDLVSGIYYIDQNPNTGDTPCAPCTFTGGDTTGLVADAGNITMGGANVSWGRWNSGFTVVENGQQQETAGSFHFMYTDSLTTQAQLDALVAARSGSYVYVYSGGFKLTDPEIENGMRGTLTTYGSGGVPSGRLYAGSYVMVNWDTQLIEQISLKAQVNDGSGTRTYHLTEATNASAGTAVQTALNDILQGGSLKLTGTCSGSDCTVGVTDTSLSGQMTFDMIGSQAEGAVTSYGASGTNPVGKDISVQGTVLLENNGPAT